MKAHAAVLLLAAAVLLAGCTTEPRVRHDIDDLATLVESSDAGALEFVRSGARQLARQDQRFLEEAWEHGEGAPDECFELYTAPYLLAGTQRGPGADDPTIGIAAFFEPDGEGLIAVSGRVFEGGNQAAGFLNAVRDAAEACPDGYALMEDGTIAWATTGSDVAELAGLPAGVTGLVVDEFPADGFSPQRTVFVQHANAVIAVHGQTSPAGRFAPEELEPIALAIAERLVAASVSPGAP